VAEPARAPRRRRAVSLDRLDALSAREKQVLSLLPRGLTNAALAAELGISPGTAKIHVERILHKLQVSDRTQAAVYAVQAGVTA
jgi:DNA-binding NarL/FixJ family response regulator